MSTINTALQNNSIISSNLSTQARQTNVKDGDGDHGIEPAASTTPVTNTVAPGQPGAIVNTMA